MHESLHIDSNYYCSPFCLEIMHTEGYEWIWHNLDALLSEIASILILSSLSKKSFEVKVKGIRVPWERCTWSPMNGIASSGKATHPSTSLRALPSGESTGCSNRKLSSKWVAFSLIDNFQCNLSFTRPCSMLVTIHLWQSHYLDGPA